MSAMFEKKKNKKKKVQNIMSAYLGKTLQSLRVKRKRCQRLK